MRPLIAILGLLLAAAAFPAAAAAQSGEDFPAGSETAASGNVSATLKWDLGELAPSNTTLTITRNGAVAFSQRIADVVCDGCLVSPDAKGDLDAFDMDGDGEAEIIVTASTGGEDCCVIMGVYAFDPATGTYGDFVQNWGTLGYGLQDLDGDGVVEVIGGDVRFQDRFSSHARSMLPLFVASYRRPGGRPELVDSSRRFPAVIRRHAATARRRYAHLRRDAGGYVAAYVADQFRLGHGAAGLKELDRQIARGTLGRPAAARAYRKRLLRTLHRFGYR